MNNQPISPLMIKHQGTSLFVFDLFYTIQGEGPFTGLPAVFIRLAGCNLQCPFCDTDYTSQSTLINVDTLTNMCLAKFEKAQGRQIVPVIKTERPLVVITGGEPLRQPINKLCTRLLEVGFRVQIETNGTIWQDLPDRVSIVCSPKTPSINSKIAARVNALKYIVDHRDHNVEKYGLPWVVLGLNCGRQVFPPPKDFRKDRVYIHPLDAGNPQDNQKNMQAAVRIATHNGYRVGIQLHKIINMP